MTRKEFRAVRVATLRDIYGNANTAIDMKGYREVLVCLRARPDPLRARMGGFTTDARSRIAVYPLNAD